MATPVNYNGVSYSIPAFGDVGYAQGPGNLSSYLIALAGGPQATGGLFSLTAPLNFGPNFGLIAVNYTTTTANPATAGQIRLAKTDTIDWRNNANSANLPLGINGSDQLTYNGVVISTAAAGGTVNAGVAGRLTLYPAAGNTVDDVYTQNAFGIDVLIATQAARSIALEYTIPNPGNAVAAATFALLELAQTFTATQTFAAVTLTGVLTGVNAIFSGTTNQIVLGTTNTVTITSPAPAASRVYTIPDVLGAASFVMTAGAQTIAGVKTFSSAPVVPNGTTTTQAVNFSQLQNEALNIADNGGFEINQRGTTSTNPANNTYGTVDRWKVQNSEATTVTVTRETTTIDTVGLASMKVVVTGSTASKYWQVMQNVENYADYRGKTLTLSVRVNANTASAVRASLYDGTTQSFSSYHTGGGAWETLTVTQAISATTTDLELIIGMCQAGDKKNGTYYFDSAMAVIAAEPVAFVGTNPEVDLARCQRFYTRLGDKVTNEQMVSLMCWTTVLALGAYQYPVPMRAAPTITFTGPTNFQIYHSTIATNATAMSASVPSVMNCQIAITVASGLTVGRAGILTQSATSSFIEFSADL